MPKLHLKRMLLVFVFALWVGFQQGYESRKAIDSNPITRLVFTGKF